MADDSLAYLASLAKPAIIEEISFEALNSTRLDDLVARFEAAGVAYDAALLETDPGVVLTEAGAYREVLLRARGNDIARAAYLYFAVGSEIDHLGEFYDCRRLAGETDARYKQRIILAIQGRSTGGTAPRYKSVAMSSSLRVSDAHVYRVGIDPTVYVAVFAADNNGVADDALLATVRAAVTADNVRMVNDTIVVRSAVVTVATVTANVWLLPDTAESILDDLEASLPTTWESERALGRDLVGAWIVGKIMAAGGAYKVTVTSPDVIVEPYRAVSIGAVTLTLMGRAS